MPDNEAIVNTVEFYTCMKL